MSRNMLSFALACFLFPSVIYATDVTGGTHVTLPPFTTKTGVAITATAVDGWSMKSAEVDNSASWTIPSIFGNNATTTYISNSTSRFNVTMKGDLIPPIRGNGSGRGPTDFSIKAIFEGELYIEPTSLTMAYGDPAKTLTAKINGRKKSSNWHIQTVSTSNSWTSPVLNGKTSITIGKNGNWDPPVGKYNVTAIDPNDTQNKASIEVFVISLSLKSENTELADISEENHRYSYIAATCTMPALRAKLQPASLPEDVEYNLEISYNRNGRNDCELYNRKMLASAEWNVNSKMGGDFRGGRAILTYKYNGLSKNMTFYIRANNPAKSTAVAYINNRTNLWYPQYVAIHESNSSSSAVMKQFNETGTFHSGDADIRYTPNASNDGGFGIFQLTNPVPTAQQLWSWHANCDEGISRLNSAQTYADNWMNAPVGTPGFPCGGQRVQARNANGGKPIPVPDKTYGNVTFSDGTAKIIEHAVALKRYNGASGGNFCSWRNGQWQFNENNSFGFNYVRRICEEVPQ